MTKEIIPWIAVTAALIFIPNTESGLVVKGAIGIIGYICALFATITLKDM